MEMATQAKTKTTATTAKLKVKAATGNGNPYTQNISTVKEQQQQQQHIAKYCSTINDSKSSQTKNNKTEIKISKSKQRNYLKFLINLYFKLKLILCISQINKSIIKILKTKPKTKTIKFVVEQICIINLTQQTKNQQLLQKTAASFKTISFKFKLVINFLTKFKYYCSQTNLVKYVKILIKNILHNKKIRHFVGICPKRLISLKRLQQIPENHAKVDDKKTSLTSHNYGSAKKRQLRQVIEIVLPISKVNKLSFKRKKKQYGHIKRQFRESFNKPVSWPAKASSKELSKSNYPSTKERQLRQIIETELPINKVYKLNFKQKKYGPIKQQFKEILNKLLLMWPAEESCKELCRSNYPSPQEFQLRQIIQPDMLLSFEEENYIPIKREFKKILNICLSSPDKESTKEYSKSNYESNKAPQLRPLQDVLNEKLLRYPQNKNRKLLSQSIMDFKTDIQNPDISHLRVNEINRHFKGMHTTCGLKETKTLESLYQYLDYKLSLENPADSMTLTPNKNSRLLRSQKAIQCLNKVELSYCKESYHKFNQIKLQKALETHNLSQTKIGLHANNGNIEEIKAEFKSFNRNIQLQQVLEHDSENIYQIKNVSRLLPHNQTLTTLNESRKHLKEKSSRQTKPGDLKLLQFAANSSSNCGQFKKLRLVSNSFQKCGQFKKIKVVIEQNMTKIVQDRDDIYKANYSLLRKHNDTELLQLLPNSPEKCGQLKNLRVVFEQNKTNEDQVKHEIYKKYYSLLRKPRDSKLQENLQCSTENYNQLNERTYKDSEFQELLSYSPKKYGHKHEYPNIFELCTDNNEQKETDIKLQIKNSPKTEDLQTVFNLNFFKINGLLKTITLSPCKRQLANNSNSAKQILWHSNNSYKNSRHTRHKESKQQEYLKKCQHFLYTIFLYYCCCCIWHIYGFPLVLVKIFKYLKVSTVHVLTRRLKISAAAAATTITARITFPFSATSIDYSFSNVIAACGGKLKNPTKVADYKGNQQNVVKRQTTTHITSDKTTTETTTTKAYSSSCCSTKSLTASPENLILLQQPQLSWTPYCHYQQHQPHHHHHQQQQLLQTQQQQTQQPHRYQPLLSPHNSSSTFHLQLPSLLVFSRTLIILILLSSLWHTSEGFHGSGVKLSTNTVKTKYGLVRGIVVRSSPSLVEAYLGIPYASPPVGSLRFMPPITPSTWKNVRITDRFSPVCPQNVPIPPNGPEALLEVPRARLAQLRRLLPLLSNQSEDCLYLNIYVPYEHRRHRRFTTNSGELNDTPKLSTILFIHGESYEWNSGNPYDGSELAAHGNVIVVTINFRLGILGFLKTGGKESAQGNFGLMDLVAGLHWLKENLPAFGGDPQAITILGHGTGAALANILVVSPVASDLVQHTVMVSGSALSPWAIQKNPLFVKRRVAEQTGCHGDMLYYDLAPCLRTKSVTELLTVKIDHPRFLAGFAPFIDGTVISPNKNSIGKLSLPLGSAIVSTSGIEYANFPKRNLIFCLTSVESHLDLSAQDLEFGFNETRRDRILRTYVRNNFHYHLNEIFAVLKNEYTDWDKAIRSPLSSRDATLQFLSDGHTASSLIKLGYMHSLKGGRGYFLHFKHRTIEEEYPQRTGSVRGEDVPFWLGLPISPLFPHNYTTQEKQISRLMLRYLANFAKTGNPNQSSLSSPLPSPSSLIGSPAASTSSSSHSSSASTSSQTADDPHEKVKRSLFNIVNATSSSSSGPIKSNAIVVDVANAAAREALNLAVLYNQRRTKRTYYKRHSRSNNDDHSGSASSEVNYFLSTNNNNNNIKLDGDELPFWDAYDVVNQLYMELGNKAEIQSHYRGHKLSMWLNLIPQLHRHANMNDQSMRHHQFQDDLNNLNLYEGIVRAQIQTKPDDDDETLLLPKGRPTPPPPPQETNTTLKPNGGTTECGVDGAMFVAEMTTAPPTDNRSLVLDSREKEMATASTGLIGNLEVLRRLSSKQFQSYTTALVATVAVGCFLLILNILIFAGIYHQREKRARDAKTKEELQDNDTSKNSSMLKLNALGSETGSFNGSGAGVSGKTTVVFGEYSCYDEKSMQTKDEKLIVELPPPQMMDPNWAACSTSTLDLLKTKQHNPLGNTYTLSNVVPINTETQTEHLVAVNAMEMANYNHMASGLIIDPSLAATSSSGLLSKRGSFVDSAGQLNQYDFASVQSSDQMSFKDIENAVKASATMDDDITQDDDIPEPPPPPRSFHSIQQQQQQQGAANVASSANGSSGGGGGGGILRQAGTTSATQTGGGKKRVHIQEISV